jgi:hypothetical protein
VHDDVDPVGLNTEEGRRLEHLETFVHQGRRVDGDLRAHRPRRMTQRVVLRGTAQLLVGPSAKRATRRSQEQAANVGIARLTRRAREALVDRAVLGVDGQQRRARRRADLGDQRGGGDERLLVRERQALAGLQGGEGHRESGEAEHRVDHDVGALGQRRQSRVANDDLHVGSHEVGQDVAMGLADHADRLHVELAGDGGEFTELFAARQCDQFEGVGLAAQHVERLGADRTSRPQERYRALRRRHR